MSSVRCHYDVLGIPCDADATTIKKAYRKLALKYHPDKNIASSSTTDQNHQTLEQLFLQVQQAYECLSDIAERKWYDDHRNAILKGWSVATGTTSHAADAHSSSASSDPNHDIVVNVAPYMYAGCYYGFDSDHPNSFYNVYQKVFSQIYQEEVHGCDRSHHHTEVEYLNVPFGNGTSSYDTIVVKFYQAWESFSSVLTYAWADQWNVQEAEQRRVRRAMEEDNGRSRRKARKIRNDEIAALVRFVKRRDPRIMAKKEEMEQSRLLREYELKELTKQRKLENELANRTWREQAEQEALAMEEDDRINGRVRLADLQDDYDYYGKKKKRGKGKKALRGDDHAEETEIDPEPPQPPLDNEDPSIPISEMDQLNIATEISVHVPCDDDDDPASLEVPSQWRCECCVGQFQNELEMMKHFKSKAHKDIAAMRKSTTDDQPAVGSLKKMKRKSKMLRPDEAVMAACTTAKNIATGSSSLESAIPNDDSHTEDDNDDDDDDDDVSNQNQVLDDDDDDDDEPLYWRCECCQKDFQSEGQMENHMNSKKHKAMYRKYEKEVGKKLLYEVVEEMTNHPTAST